MDKDLMGLGTRIDGAAHAGDAELLLRLDGECLALLEMSEGAQGATIHYYRSNIYASLQHLEAPQSWRWRQPYLEHQILHLRQARTHVGFASLPQLVRAQITTNLANNLSHLGRSVEAIALYDEALCHQPRFAMALGNRGLARKFFADALHDCGHAGLIRLAAYDDLTAAGSVDAVWDNTYPDAREQFATSAKQIETAMDIAACRSGYDLEGYSLGRSKLERNYRWWALKHQLFLNPINVLGSHMIAATDHFGLPSYRSPIDEPPQFIMWFNQLKQEYAFARLLFFEAETGPINHFADRDLMLVDTLDFPAFGVSLEKMRLAFRTAYSLLDKIAGFINAYFELGNSPKRVDLRNVWLTKNSSSIRPELAERPNWALRGLYWLAFDIVGEEASAPDTISPEASDLYRLRNSLEHRCLILRDFVSSQTAGVVESTTVEAFRERTLTMFKLARASLIYLSLAVGREERERSKKCERISLPISLPTYSGRIPL